jgi:hypothetical protein
MKLAPAAFLSKPLSACTAVADDPFARARGAFAPAPGCVLTPMVLSPRV